MWPMGDSTHSAPQTYPGPDAWGTGNTGDPLSAPNILTHSLTHSHRALSPGEVIVLLKCKKKIPPQVSCILKLKQTSL